MPINVLDAIGLSVFGVLGAHKALELGFGVVQAVIVGTITGVGVGTIRDVIRMLGVRFDLHAPRPPGHRRPDRPDDPTGHR